VIARWRGPVAWMLAVAAFTFACGYAGMLLHPDTAFGYPHPITQRIIRQEVARAHFSHADADALITLGWRESRLHRYASNRGRCLGVFQLSRSMCIGKPWADIRWNTHRAIVYIRHRYGTPVRALAHSRRYGWY